MSEVKRKSVLDPYFTDASFRLLIRPARISKVDDPKLVSKAIHEEIELKYFYEGTSTLLIGSQTIVAQPGDLVVINPYELHSTIHQGGDRGKYQILMMDPDFFLNGSTGGLDLRSMIIGKGLTFQTLVRGDPRISDMMGRIIEAYEKKAPHWQFTVRAVLLELFVLLLQEYSKELPGEGDGDFRCFETVEPAIRRIREGYASPITVDELATLCNVSKCHFCRVFRKATGQSAMRYLTEYRLKIADLMLSGSGSSVGAIAEQCGFEDEGYFCRCYKAHYGITPGKKRNQKA